MLRLLGLLFRAGIDVFNFVGSIRRSVQRSDIFYRFSGFDLFQKAASLRHKKRTTAEAIAQLTVILLCLQQVFVRPGVKNPQLFFCVKVVRSVIEHFNGCLVFF
ncbi:hypothetical protein SDC9_63226 [bioreactor metagenome]|uniref:Uncharacterized protein n=1 Tax=bioreactor metagenome TaxID=1076179 RepID=A0A644XRU4_9ZZZZ